MKNALIIIALLTITGCGMDYHLRKANYHLRLAQAKGAVIKTDTIYKEVPVYTETKVYDTVVMRHNTTDTLFINTTKYSVKLKYDTITRTQYVRVECKADTVMVTVPVSVPITIEDPFNPYKLWPWIVLIVIALVGALYFYSTRK